MSTEQTGGVKTSSMGYSQKLDTLTVKSGSTVKQKHYEIKAGVSVPPRGKKK